MPKIAINQDNQLVCYLEWYTPNMYIRYKLIAEVTHQQLLYILELSPEDLKILTDQLLLSITQIDEHKRNP